MPFPWLAAATAAGSILGGAGQAAGGFGSIFGKGDKELYDYGDHREMIQAEYRNRLKYARKFGQKYGFHPLAALGMQTSYPAMQRIGGRRGVRGYADAGHGLGKLMEGVARVVEASKKSDIPGQPETVREEQLPMTHPSYGSGEMRGRAVQPLEQLYRSGNTIVAMPAEGAQDFMSESFFAMAPYAAKQIMQFFATGRGAYPEKTIVKFRDKLNGVEDFLRSHNEIRQDEYLAWSHDSGQIKVMRSISGRKKKLFSGRSPKYKRQPNRYGGMFYRRN